MKIVALCFLALVAGALADCGCLKCNPNLRLMSPENAPMKIIFRDGNRNCPYRAPYTLQAAIPFSAQPFVPNEYDYQLQVIPVGTPLSCGGSTYEYGLQSAIVPPERPIVPLRNLRTATERVVLDSPICAFVGGSTCNTGSPCPLLANRPSPPPSPLRYQYRSRGPIFEVLNANTCGRYALINSNTIDKITRSNFGKFQIFRQNRELSDGRNVKIRHKRDILDLPMNFMFKFLPNLFKGPILHVLHSIQHNANPAVIRARANANQQVLKAHAAKVKLKHNHIDHNFKDKTGIAKLSPNKKLKNHLPSHKIGKVPIDKKWNNELVANPKSHIPGHLSNKHLYHDKNDFATNTIDLWKNLLATLNTSKGTNFHQNNKAFQKLNDIKTDKESISIAKPLIPHHFTKHFPHKQFNHGITDNSIQSNKFWKDLLDSLNPKKSQNGVSKVTSLYKTGTSSKVIESEAEELQNLLSQNGYTPEIIRNLLLENLRSFNENHERNKRSLTSEKFLKNRRKSLYKLKEDIINNSNASVDPKHVLRVVLLQKLKKFNEIFKRKKRSILLNSDEFSLPFFEIEDEVLDNATNDLEKSEEIVGSKQYQDNQKRHRRKYEESEMESGEELLGRPSNEHPFVVLLRAPLQFLHQFHDIRKNFRPILYSFPKLLRSSKRYLRDFGKNIQTGVLDFASNVIGDFDNTVPHPRRPKRSVEEKLSGRDSSINKKRRRPKRYILKVVDEDEVQEFLEQKLGGYFDDDDEKKSVKENKSPRKTEKDSGEATVSEDHHKKKTNEKKFLVRKLAPKVILDNNGKAFIEINGNKRPLFNSKHHHGTSKATEKTNHKADKESPQHDSKDADPPEHVINDKIDEVINKAKLKLKDGDVLESCSSDEMPTQTVKEKIFQISADIQNLINLDFCEYNEIYEGLLKLENLRKLTAEYWKNVMINEKTNDIRCKIRILNYFREMQIEKDIVTKKIAELLKTTDKFIVKKMIKLLVRLQKLQCLIQKVVDHFDNRMKIGTITDTEREIKFVDYLSSINFVVDKNKEDLECTLNKDKNDALERGIRLLENLRILLQKDDTYIINEIAKQIWEMKNIEKLQHDTIEEMNKKLEENMKIRKELKILFDLLKQIEASEETCEKLLSKYDTHIVGSKSLHVHDKRIRDKLTLAERLRKLRVQRRTPSTKVK